MTSEQDRRDKERISFSWPLWFSFIDNGELFRGQVIDFNGSHVSFTVEEKACPCVGQHIETRFSYPLHTADEFEMGSYMHWSEVIRVDPTMTARQRVALRLHQPITLSPLQPAEAVPAQTG